MNYKTDFPGYQTIGKHSNYSRYKTCNPLNIGHGFNYSYDPEEFPERDPAVFRIVTLNCNRFPRTLWSESILTCLLFAALPDVLILQEVKAMPVLHNVINAVTKSALPGDFGMFAGRECSSGLNLATVYRTTTLVNSSYLVMFQNLKIQSLYSLRYPILLETFFADHRLHHLNLHGVSRSQRDNLSIRAACLTEMSEYFEIPINRAVMIIGGDWNINSDSQSLVDHFPNFHIFLNRYFNTSDHFIVSHELISAKDIVNCSQYQMNIQQYLQLSEANYLLYMSDHFPVVLDIPVDLL